MAGGQDHYYTLGIERSASAEEIKAAYRARAKLYHPDTAPGGGDPGKFARLTEAYEVLRHAEKRAAYDASLIEAPAPSPGLQPFEVVVCSVCKKPTAQPRYAVFWTTVSYLLGTLRTPTQGIFCSACARSTALKCSGISAVVGWWGVWGLIWTPMSIIANARGGDRPTGSEARLLWYNALAFLSQGKTAMAHALARKVAGMNSDLAGDALELRVKLEQAGVPADGPELRDPWQDHAAHAAGHVLMLVALPLLLVGWIQLSEAGGTGQVPSYEGDSYVAPLSPSVSNSPDAVAPEVEAEPPPAPTCDRTLSDGEVLAGSLPQAEFGHRLEVRNGSAGPAIIKVRNAMTGKVEVAFYVSKGGRAAVEPLPDGQYRIQYATGEALAADCRSFTKIQSASEFPEVQTFQIREEGDRLIAQELSYTLYGVPMGNVRPETIDPSAFEAE